MASRSRFQPDAVAPLEERIALSHLMTHAHAQVHVAGKASATFGALGDSLSDEYKFYAPDRSQARNWVEVLAGTKRVNFGSFTTASRGEPRDQGFDFDWARSEAVSADVVKNQLPGLAQQVASGQVRYVSILMGDNDFGHFLQAVATGGAGFNPTAILAQVDQIERTAEANLDTTVRTLLAAHPDVRLVVNTAFDLTQTPLFRQVAGVLGPIAQPLLTATSQAIGRYNDHIRAVAADGRVALADQAALMARTGSSLVVGGTRIDTTPPGDEYHHLYLADGFHPGTVGQGAIAQTIIAAVNAKFHAGISRLKAPEIIQFAKNYRRYR